MAVDALPDADEGPWRTSVASAVIVAAWVVALVLIGAWFVRASAVEQETLASRRIEETEVIARLLEQSVQDIGDDLRVAGRLVQTMDTPADGTRELRALLTMIRPYRCIEVFSSGGERILHVEDPNGLGVERVRAERALTATADAARKKGPNMLVSAPRFDDDLTGSSRVFALHMAASESDEITVAVLVDMRPLLATVRLVEPGEVLRTFVVGSHGRAFSSSDSSLVARLESVGHARGAASVLLGKIHNRERGSMQLDEGALLDESEPTLAAFVPLDVADRERWTVASIGTQRSLDAKRRAFALQGILAAGISTLLSGAVLNLVVSSSRRARQLRTDLRRALELAHLAELNKRILNTIPTGVLVLGADGTVWDANQAILRGDTSSHRSRTLASVATLDGSSEQLDELVRSSLHTRTPTSCVGVSLSVLGEPVQANLHFVPIDPPLPHAALLLVIEDISRLRALETQLMRAEKLATIGVLAAGVAHEIGTPLGVIRGRAEYIRGKLGGDHPQSKGVSTIVEQIDRISRTIRQLLDFSRARPVATGRVEVETLVAQVIELVRFEAERRQVEVVGRVDGNVPPVRADADPMQQVLVNLVMNALDASAPGQRVSLSVSAPDDGVVEICVHDDGAGIAPELRHRIFDPFFTTKKRGQGTGLGLTIVAQIVQAQGGAVDVQSAPGQGTSFRVKLPTAPVRHNGDPA